MSCDQDKKGTGLRFLVDARRSRRPCRLLPLASAAAIVAAFSTAALGDCCFFCRCHCRCRHCCYCCHRRLCHRTVAVAVATVVVVAATDVKTVAAATDASAAAIVATFSTAAFS